MPVWQPNMVSEKISHCHSHGSGLAQAARTDAMWASTP